MAEQYRSMISDEERAARHMERAAARKKKLRTRRIKRMKQLFPVIAFFFLLVGLFVLWRVQSQTTEPPPDPAPTVSLPTASMPEIQPEDLPQEPEFYTAETTASTIALSDSLDSSYAVLIDVASGKIIAAKDAFVSISPASMTKVLTLLVAAEHAQSLDDSITMTIEITDYCFVNDCSVVGLEVGESATIRELLYGCILPSGADACLALANYISGSQEAFVELMNQKLEELGLSETAHFNNCVGLYDKEHFCSAYDMAMILKAAMDNELCREVLKARTFETNPTAEHPEGQVLSNWFLRRIEDRFAGDFQIVAGKTGYVTQSGSCAVSGGQDAAGNLYICVTGDASSAWRVIYDHTELYQTYCG